MAKQDISKEAIRKDLTNPLLRTLAIDADEYPDHVFDYVNMYISIYRLDKAGYRSILEIPKFSIKTLIEELGKLSKKERDTINKFFGITGVKHYLKLIKDNDIALKNMIYDASEAAAKLRTAEKMYAYNKRFREAIDQIAAKVHDPEGIYTPLEKAKFAHLYFWFIKDFQYMPYDGSRRKAVMDPIETNAENDQFPVTESYVAEWDNFYANIPDGDLVIPQITQFIWESDMDLDQLMVEFADLYSTHGIKGEHVRKNSYPCFIMCGKIRAAKERLFTGGQWNCDYMRISEFAKLPEETIKDLIEAYNIYKVDYGYDTSTCNEYVRWHAFFRTKGDTIVKFPKISKKRNFVDEYEMIYFIGIIEYIEKYVPDYSFHGRSFKSYGFGKMIA